ncbi:DUF3135 domain-containing protein [Pseudoteredinibacter isoporae]|uniref:DUF3135 domain-containing protein n=1 Tax=Pseudoteredinibacter isoporae TaxID=570281 RepID=UPI00310B742E
MSSQPKATSTELSFDELKDLAVNDPAAFEAYRSRQIEATISNAPSHMQRRLRGIQFQVDAQRELHSNPMGSCVKVYEMMQKSLGELSQVLNEQTGKVDVSPAPAVENAKVLSFTR